MNGVTRSPSPGSLRLPTSPRKRGEVKNHQLSATLTADSANSTLKQRW